ncbi:MAG: biopolymer transporter ExbD [Myxococcaceae bacterium]|nr:biopolymer transporter ExbD [Myxococcaceae bacterium]
MAMTGGTGGGGLKSEINVTPLVDVVLVLLIIFMVVTPMLQRGKDVQLPRATATAQEDAARDPLVISVTARRELFLESEALGEDALEVALRAELTRQPGRKVLLKGDTALDFQDVRRVLRVARRAGARGVALGVEEIKR